MNRLYFGDNLHILRGHIADNSVDLIYLDPPFNSKATYNILYKAPDGADAQVKAFEDTWRWDTSAAIAMAEVSQGDTAAFNVLRAFQAFLGQSDMMAYLAMMAVRLVELRRVLKPTGSLYLHCDPTASHYLRILLDAVFGPSAYVNEIIWKRYGAHNDVGQGSRHYGRVHDTLLFYAPGATRTWNQQFIPLTREYIDANYTNIDERTGERYTTTPMTGPGGAEKGNPVFEWNGHTRAWRYSKETMQELHDQGRLHYSGTGYARRKLFAHESKGVPVQSIWSDIPSLSGSMQERLGFPTQKPLALLDRIIKTSSKEGDVVLDPFCGCGTAVHAAEKLGRTWIGIDIAYLAIQVIEDRIKHWLPAARYEVNGIPNDEHSARKLAERDPHTFQQWAVGRLGGQSRGKGADKGIDGQINFQVGQNDYRRAIVSVKGGRNVNPDMVRALKGVVEREGADMGVFVCLDPPSKDMRGEAASAAVIELPSGLRPRIQIVTVVDLIAGPDLGFRTQLNTITSAKAARKVARRKPAKRPTAEELRMQPPLPPMPIKGGKGKAQPSLPMDEPLLTRPPAQRRRHT